jgi:hypothetical protein
MPDKTSLAQTYYSDRSLRQQAYWPLPRHLQAVLSVLCHQQWNIRCAGKDVQTIQTLDYFGIY